MLLLSYSFFKLEGMRNEWECGVGDVKGWTRLDSVVSNYFHDHCGIEKKLLFRLLG